jgi:hypothetical protein
MVSVFARFTLEPLREGVDVTLLLSLKPSAVLVLGPTYTIGIQALGFL